MQAELNVLMVSAECAPFAKSGGLGDVIGSLPQYLQKLGCKVIVVMPLYSFISIPNHNIVSALDRMEVWLGNELITCGVRKSTLPGEVPVYLIDYQPFFGRPGMYHDSFYNDYHDNPTRFAFLSKAALELCHYINFNPDIVHANDWHTAILSAYVRRLYRHDPVFSTTATVLTIHNIAYQGRYNRYYYFITGLGPEDFTQDKFEHYHDVNFLKGGIYFADQVNTVSRGYADETRVYPGGYGLEYFLNRKGDDYTGILNGADYSQWNPETDRLIPANYSINDLSGKKVCKEELQKQMGLEHFEQTPVIGVISRLVEQKGFQIVAECIEDLLNTTEVQFAILGSGDKNLENYFSSLPERFPGKVAVYIAYDNELAHLIEAGSDFFLMPSIYEPCGLNQIYSLKYGTLPIVRATGGLNDTIENYNQQTGEGTGFKFTDATCPAASNTIKWAVDTYYNRKDHLQKLIHNAMMQNFSWEDSAKEYIRMYEKAFQKINQARSMPIIS
jgi:starch synthase